MRLNFADVGDVIRPLDQRSPKAQDPRCPGWRGRRDALRKLALPAGPGQREVPGRRAGRALAHVVEVVRGHPGQLEAEVAAAHVGVRKDHRLFGEVDPRDRIHRVVVRIASILVGGIQDVPGMPELPDRGIGDVLGVPRLVGPLVSALRQVRVREAVDECLQAVRVGVLGLPVEHRRSRRDRRARRLVGVQGSVAVGAGHSRADPLQVLLGEHVSTQILHPRLDRLDAAGWHEQPYGDRPGHQRMTKLGSRGTLPAAPSRQPLQSRAGPRQERLGPIRPTRHIDHRGSNRPVPGLRDREDPRDPSLRELRCHLPELAPRSLPRRLVTEDTSDKLIGPAGIGHD